ncbi:MAG TPA: TonB-dependent receptor [Sphingomicrobium sp.]|nr:TonB-dependent receptor [Sphingomicrobium sp.]
MKKFVLLCTTAMLPSAAFAQSTGTITTEEEQIVITGAKTKQVGGFEVPDTTKAKAAINQELIERQQSGQTILNVVNLVPGVNFTNSDPYGSSGGSIRIRGFDGNRISLTFDGVPLNDSGNYAIFSNQQLDPELVEQINVGLGVTDVDSPTASAAGGTINYRTIMPTESLGARLSASLGTWDYRRMFGQFNSGRLTSMGTKGWLAVSRARNDKFKGPGEISKHQFNARIYQPVGSAGDFVSVSGHYNRNRNNFYRNPNINDLRAILGSGEIPATPSQNPPGTFIPTAANPFRIGYFDGGQEDLVMEFDNLAVCNRTVPQAGTVQNDNAGTGPNGTGANAPAQPVAPSGPNYGVTQNNPLNSSSCTNYYNVRINPSNTGNIRGQSRFTLRDGLLLTIDPSFQYVLANGGGSTALAESSARARGGNPTGPGVDFNGDGDFLDSIRFFTPNNTNTHRIGLTSSLIWQISPLQRVRVAYTYDRAHHRQTGEWGFLERGGDPESPFGGRNGRPVLDSTGFKIQQRDRTSIALLNQISGQYIGRFFDEKLRAEVGVRRPFFKRNLNQHCYTEARGSGFAYCTSEPASSLRIIGPNDPVPSTGPVPYYAPFKAQYKYGKLLPNIGFTYSVTNPISIFGSYAKGFSAPRTDNLYRAPRVDVKPEETNAFDLGVRYTTSLIQAQLAAWKIDYRNRIVSSFNQDLGISIDRNVGRVSSHGFDGSFAIRPTRQLTLLTQASYIRPRFKDNVEIGQSTAAALPAGLIFCSGTPPTGTATALTCAPTAGRMVSETPKWQFGGRAQYRLKQLSFGIQGKRVGSRFATDVNDVKLKGYTLVDLDARLDLDEWVKTKNTYLQLNVQNLFDTFYFGNISTQIRASDNPSFAVGAPRTVSATLNVGF